MDMGALRGGRMDGGTVIGMAGWTDRGTDG